MEDDETPAKPTQEQNEHQETAVGRQQEQEESAVDDYERQLTEVEDLIESLGKKLRELYFENLRSNRDDIERRKQLEDERTSLRKQLIDASHQHKLLIQST